MSIRPDDIPVHIRSIIERLVEGGHSAQIVGGAVRDILLGAKPKDFDVITSAHPQHVRKLFRRCHLVGRRFRLALVHTYHPRHHVTEVATYRDNSDDVDSEDVQYEDSGRMLSDNAFGTIDTDACRRDFTINALYYDVLEDLLIDKVGGLDDIDNRLVRMIGDDVQLRLREDPLRAVRAVRFACNHGIDIEPSLAALLPESRPWLDAIPRARIGLELSKIFSSQRTLDILDGLSRYGLLDVMVPEIIEDTFIPGKAQTMRDMLNNLDAHAHDTLAKAEWAHSHRSTNTRQPQADSAATKTTTTNAAPDTKHTRTTNDDGNAPLGNNNDSGTNGDRDGRGRDGSRDNRGRDDGQGDRDRGGRGNRNDRGRGDRDDRDGRGRDDGQQDRDWGDRGRDDREGGRSNIDDRDRGGVTGGFSGAESAGDGGGMHRIDDAVSSSDGGGATHGAGDAVSVEGGDGANRVNDAVPGSRDDDTGSSSRRSGRSRRGSKGRGGRGGRGDATHDNDGAALDRTSNTNVASANCIGYIAPDNRGVSTNCIGYIGPDSRAGYRSSARSNGDDTRPYSSDKADAYEHGDRPATQTQYPPHLNDSDSRPSQDDGTHEVDSRSSSQAADSQRAESRSSSQAADSLDAASELSLRTADALDVDSDSTSGSYDALDVDSKLSSHTSGGPDSDSEHTLGDEIIFPLSHREELRYAAFYLPMFLQHCHEGIESFDSVLEAIDQVNPQILCPTDRAHRRGMLALWRTLPRLFRLKPGQMRRFSEHMNFPAAWFLYRQGVQFGIWDFDSTTQAWQDFMTSRHGATCIEAVRKRNLRAGINTDETPGAGSSSGGRTNDREGGRTDSNSRPSASGRRRRRGGRRRRGRSDAGGAPAQ